MLIDGWGIAASLALIAVAVGLSLWRRLDLAGTIGWAGARAAIQLALVGLVLVPVLSVGSPLLWSWLWIAGMLVVAVVTVRSRAPEVPGLVLVSAVAIGVSLVVSLAVVFGLRILPLEPVALVPVAGILLGNTMPSTVLAVRRTVEELRTHLGQVEAMLALGFPPAEARRQHVREAARTALVPQIERTKVVGLVALPGAMVGLLLAGVDPLDAVAVQLVVMYLILGSVAVSVIAVSLGIGARAFTAEQNMAGWVTSR